MPHIPCLSSLSSCPFYAEEALDLLRALLLHLGALRVLGDVVDGVETLRVTTKTHETGAHTIFREIAK